MEADDLTSEQAKIIHDRLAPTVGYLHKLLDRMVKRGFVPKDPLYQQVADTYNRLRGLTMELHHLSCREGVGRKRKR